MSRAFHEALASECPEFVAVEAQRLDKVIERGRIRTEAEFHLVRHHIDVLEGEPELGSRLRQLYALAGAFETGR